MKSATYANDEVLSKFKATKCEVNKDSTYLLMHGWKFHSSHDKICNSKDLLNLARNIESIVNRNSSTPSTSDTSNIENSSGHEHHDNTSDHIHINGYSLHSPPMLFLNDCNSIQHVSSKISITHRASDALVAWAVQHSAKVMSQHPLEIVQVPYANTWTKRSLPQIDSNNNSSNNSSSLSTGVTDNIKSIATAVDTNKSKWDWTFTSDYCCTIDVDNNSSNDGELVSSHQVEKNSSTIVTATVLADYVDNNTNTSSSVSSSNQQQQQDQHQHQYFPFKYHSTTTASTTTTAEEDVQHNNQFTTTSSSIDNSDNKSSSKSSSSSTSSSDWQWQFEPAPHSGLNMALLRRGSENPKEAPILFYDEFTLYQDDLEDCGEVTFDGKVRVMPLCWFTLIRCFVRVDDGIVRMKETRLFHVFNTDDNTTDDNNNNSKSNAKVAVKIHVVVTWKELDLSSSSSSTSSSSPSAVPPQSLSKSILRNANELSERMPVVNQKYNIPQFYTLHFIPPQA